MSDRCSNPLPWDPLSSPKRIGSGREMAQRARGRGAETVDVSGQKITRQKSLKMAQYGELRHRVLP